MYARLDELKSELNIAVDTNDAILRDALKWASDYVDRVTHRQFSAEVATRYYDSRAIDPNDRALLIVDEDLLGIGTLTNGDASHTVLPGSAYVLWDRNDSPYWGIRLKSGYSWTFDTDEVVTIVGTWGYSTTPPDLVKGWTLRLATWRYKARTQDPTTTVFAESVQTSKPPPFVDDVIAGLEPVTKVV